MKSLLISSMIASAPVAAIPQNGGSPPDGGVYLVTPPGCVVGEVCRVIDPAQSTATEDVTVSWCTGPNEAMDCFTDIYSGPVADFQWITEDPGTYGYDCTVQFFYQAVTVSGGYNWSARYDVSGCGVAPPPTDCTCPDDPACNPIPDPPCTDPNGYCNGNNGVGVAPVPYDPSCPGGYDANNVCIDTIAPVPDTPCDDTAGIPIPVPDVPVYDPSCPSGNYDANNVCVDSIPVPVYDTPCDDTAGIPVPPVDTTYGCSDPNGNCGGSVDPIPPVDNGYGWDPACPDGIYDDTGACVSPVPVDNGYGWDPTCPDGIYDDAGACVSPVPPVDNGYGCPDPNGSCWDDDTSDDDTAGIPGFPIVDFTDHCGPAPTDPTQVADYVHNCMFQLVATVFVDICATINVNVTGGVGVGTGGNPFTY